MHAIVTSLIYVYLCVNRKNKEEGKTTPWTTHELDNYYVNIMKYILTFFFFNRKVVMSYYMTHLVVVVRKISDGPVKSNPGAVPTVTHRHDCAQIWCSMPLITTN